MEDAGWRGLYPAGRPRSQTTGNPRAFVRFSSVSADEVWASPQQRLTAVTVALQLISTLWGWRGRPVFANIRAWKFTTIQYSRWRVGSLIRWLTAWKSRKMNGRG